MLPSARFRCCSSSAMPFPAPKPTLLLHHDCQSLFLAFSGAHSHFRPRAPNDLLTIPKIGQVLNQESSAISFSALPSLHPLSNIKPRSSPRWRAPSYSFRLPTSRSPSRTNETRASRHFGFDFHHHQVEFHQVPQVSRDLESGTGHCNCMALYKYEYDDKIGW
jgi:hypothetical protein